MNSRKSDTLRWTVLQIKYYIGYLSIPDSEDAIVKEVYKYI